MRKHYRRFGAVSNALVVSATYTMAKSIGKIVWRKIAEASVIHASKHAHTSVQVLDNSSDNLVYDYRERSELKATDN